MYVVHRLQLTGEAGKPTSVDVKFYQNYTYLNHQNRLIFDRVIQK